MELLAASPVILMAGAMLQTLPLVFVLGSGVWWILTHDVIL